MNSGKAHAIEIQPIAGSQLPKSVASSIRAGSPTGTLTLGTFICAHRVWLGRTSVGFAICERSKLMSHQTEFGIPQTPQISEQHHSNGQATYTINVVLRPNGLALTATGIDAQQLQHLYDVLNQGPVAPNAIELSKARDLTLASRTRQREDDEKWLRAGTERARAVNAQLSEPFLRVQATHGFIQRGDLVGALEYAWFGCNQLHTFYGMLRSRGDGPRSGHVPRDTLKGDEDIVASYLDALRRVLTAKPTVSQTNNWERSQSWRGDLISDLGRSAHSPTIQKIGQQVKELAVATDPTQPAATTPPGWHPDPWQHHSLRWWDGQVWTGHTSN